MSASRAARRRQEKAARKQGVPVPQPIQQIVLQNPVSDHFPTFICGQAFAWQVKAMYDIEAQAPPHVFDDVAEEFQACKPGFALPRSLRFQAALDAFCDEGKRYMVREGEAVGRELVICGAGPSLVEHASEYCRDGVDVWGCNSALIWLHDHGYHVTHGFTVDQTSQMLVEWQDAPDVEYLIATSVHPHLSDHLVGKGRRTRWFHNFVGIDRPPVQVMTDGEPESIQYEQWMYSTLFPPTIMVGSGLNAVTRAIDVARYMGYTKITVLGADCCLRITKPVPKGVVFGTPDHKRWLEESTVMHADGGSAIAGEQSPLTLGAVIDSGTPDSTVRDGHGRHWETKVDLVISAVWLVKFAQQGVIQLVGDTLPNALLGKTDEFLKRLPGFTSVEGEVVLPEVS